MAIYKFTDNIFKSKKVFINGDGNHQRDFTYIDEITNSIYKLIKLDSLNYRHMKSRIFNIGNGQKTTIKKVIQIIEKNLNKKAIINYSKPLKVDMEITHASFKKLENIIGNSKKVGVESGIKKFTDWYLNYMK